MTVEKRVLCLKMASGITIATGLFMAVAAIPELAGPTVVFLDLVFWPFDGMQSLDAPEARLLTAVTGGVLVGWAALIWMVATQVYASDPALGRRLILTSLLNWFVIDSSMSVAAGAPLNVVGNLFFLALYVLPILSSPTGSARATDIA